MTTDILRQITGTLRTPEGQPFPNKTITWFRELRAVQAQGASVVLDQPFFVATDAAGAINHSVLAGNYLLMVGLRDADRYFRVSVPDESGPFNIADLLDAPPVDAGVISEMQALLIEARGVREAVSTAMADLTSLVDAAEAAAGSAAVNADVYPTTAAGIAATAVGEQFQVVVGQEIIRYRHDAGPVATEVARYPTAGRVSAETAARIAGDAAVFDAAVADADLSAYYGSAAGEIEFDLRLDDLDRILRFGNILQSAPNDGAGGSAYDATPVAGEEPLLDVEPVRAFFGGGGVRQLRLSAPLDLMGKHLLIPIDVPQDYPTGISIYVIGGTSSIGIRRTSETEMTVWASNLGGSTVSITAPFKAGRQVLAVRIAGGKLVVWRDGELLGSANVSWSAFAVDRIGYSTSNAPGVNKVWRGSIGRMVAINVMSDTDDHMAIRAAAHAVAGFTTAEPEKWLGARPARPLAGHSVGSMYYDTAHDAVCLKVAGGWQPMTRPTSGIASYYGVEDGDIVLDLRLDDPDRMSLVGDAIRHVHNDGSADQTVASYSAEAPSAVSDPPRAFFGDGGVRLLRLSSDLDLYGKHLLIPIDLPSPFGVGMVKYLIGGQSTFGIRRRSAGQLTVFISHAGATSLEVSFAYDADRLVLGARFAGGAMIVSCNGKYMGEVAIPWDYLPVDRIGHSTTNNPSTGNAWNGSLGRMIVINAPSVSRDYPAVSECLTALSEVYLPPAPEWEVIRPPYHGSWRNPVVPAWQPPAGWSHPDPAWPLVAGQFDFGRMGMDQSEHAHPSDYANDAIPITWEDGIAELLATGGLCTDAPSPLWCPSELTVDVYGLTPASGVVVAASDATVRWSLGWTGSGWSVKVGASTVSIADAGTDWPADIALVVRDSTAAVYRDGSLVGTAAVSEVPPASTRLSIGGDRVSGTWHAHTLGMVRVTSAARYRGDYVPMRPRSAGAARLGGGAILGYGAWTWYNDDRAIGAAGKALFGATTAAALVHSYDPGSGHVRVSKAASWPGRNDHNNPALLTRLDGNQVMICTGHNHGPFVAAATNIPGQVHDLAWTNIGAEIGASDASYTNIHQLGALPGAPIFQFGRQSFGGAYQIYMARSDDAGATWSHVGAITGVGPRPYIKTIKSAEDRIDIFTTMTHPEVPNPALRHLYWDGEVMRDTFGVQISAPGSLTTDLNLATELWSAAADGLNSWTGSLHLIGRSLVAWGFVYSGAGGHYLRYILDLTEAEPLWRGEYVCDAGGDLGSSRRYLGGICSHPRDPDRAYASIAHSGRDFQLVELQRGPTGYWSVTRQITDTPPGVRNFRPYPIRDPDMLLWVTGRYDGYGDYSCGIAGLAI